MTQRTKSAFAVYNNPEETIENNEVENEEKHENGTEKANKKGRGKSKKAPKEPLTEEQSQLAKVTAENDIDHPLRQFRKKKQKDELLLTLSMVEEPKKKRGRKVAENLNLSSPKLAKSDEDLERIGEPIATVAEPVRLEKSPKMASEIKSNRKKEKGSVAVDVVMKKIDPIVSFPVDEEKTPKSGDETKRKQKKQKTGVVVVLETKTTDLIAAVAEPVHEEKTTKSDGETKDKKTPTLKKGKSDANLKGETKNAPMLAVAYPVNKEKTSVDEKKPKQKVSDNFSVTQDTKNMCKVSLIDGPTEALNKNFKSFADSLTFDNSLKEAEKTFHWMTFPINKMEFMEEIFEHKPYYVNRFESIPQYYQGLFSTEDLLKIISENDLEYGVNLDVTRYVDGVRTTENPEGRVYSKVVEDFFTDGCSIRLLNPQSYSQSVWLLTSTLQEFFGTFVGANVYLTPPGTQGFAPHYDDIDAFVLQLEGKKRWSVYEPKPKDALARFSSRNFFPNEIGKPVMTGELNPGDLLYMPRGYIHQIRNASCLPSHHSLHITISSTQLNTYADLFEKMLPAALKIAADRDIEFRRSLPLNYMRFSGVAFEDSEKANPDRVHFQTQVKTLFKRLTGFLPIDGACDQMAKKFIAESQPPALTDDEKMRCVIGSDVKFDQKSSAVVSTAKEFDLKTEVRLIRCHCLRLLVEGDGEPIVYHNVNNSRVYQGKELQKITVTEEEATAVEYLIKAYPSYSRISSLPLKSDSDKVDFCLSLFEKCLLMTKDLRAPTKRC